MAFLSKFKFDIFVSYAHRDNRVPGGKKKSRKKGWIVQFHEFLDVKLKQRLGDDRLKIWWDDRKLDGGLEFDTEIQEAINESAIFLALTSRSYLNSDYCKLELQTFYEKAQRESLQLSVNNRPRILNLRLYNVPFSEWPEIYPRTPGFEFFEAKDVDEFGRPTDPDSKLYEDQGYYLIDAIDKLMQAIEAGGVSAPPASESSPKAAAEIDYEFEDGVESEDIPEVKDPGKTVLIDFHFKDYEYAERLSVELRNSGLSVLYGPDEDDPQNYMAFYRDRLMESRALIICFGHVNEAWVIDRIKSALQIVFSEDLPIRIMGLYLAPPGKPKFELENSLPGLHMPVFDNSVSPKPDFQNVLRILEEIGLE